MGNNIVAVHKFSGEVNDGLLLQFWTCPELTNVTVTAPGGLTRELIHRGRLQLQFSILVNLSNNYSTLVA